MKLVNVRTIIYTDTCMTVVSYYSTNEILKCFIERIYNTGIKVYDSNCSNTFASHSIQYVRLLFYSYIAKLSN